MFLTFGWGGFPSQWRYWFPKGSNSTLPVSFMWLCTLNSCSDESFWWYGWYGVSGKDPILANICLPRNKSPLLLLCKLCMGLWKALSMKQYTQAYIVQNNILYYGSCLDRIFSSGPDINERDIHSTHNGSSGGQGKMPLDGFAILHSQIWLIIYASLAEQWFLFFAQNI